MPYDSNLFSTADVYSVNQNVQWTFKAQTVDTMHFLNSCTGRFKPMGSAGLLWYLNISKGDGVHPSKGLVVQKP